MEDLYISEELDKLKFDDESVVNSIKEIAEIIKNNRRNDFKFLCAIRNLIKQSSHGAFILNNGDVSLLKYTRIRDKDYLLLELLQKYFGFSQKYLERITRVILKFICVNSQDFKTLEFKFDFCNDLTISKMQYLIGLSDYQIQVAFSCGDLTIKSTQKDIQDYVKSLKGKKENKVLENLEDMSEVPIDKCQQYVVFSLDDFEFIKNIVLDKKNKLNDTSAVISAMIKYFKDNNIKF